MIKDQTISKGVKSPKGFDLEERTVQFSQAVITFVKGLKETTVTRPLISQLVRAATSVGANYHEAQEASSRKDFANKVSIAKKEIKETRYWLRLLAHTIPEGTMEARGLWKEAQELNLILAAIVRKAKG